MKAYRVAKFMYDVFGIKTKKFKKKEEERIQRNQTLIHLLITTPIGSFFDPNLFIGETSELKIITKKPNSILYSLLIYKPEDIFNQSNHCEIKTILVDKKNIIKEITY